MGKRDINYITQKLGLDIATQTSLHIRFLAPELNTTEIESTVTGLVIFNGTFNLYGLSIANIGNQDSEVDVFDGFTRKLFGFIVPARGIISSALGQGHIGMETNLRIEKDNVFAHNYTILGSGRFVPPT